MASSRLLNFTIVKHRAMALLRNGTGAVIMVHAASIEAHEKSVTEAVL